MDVWEVGKGRGTDVEDNVLLQTSAGVYVFVPFGANIECRKH